MTIRTATYTAELHPDAEAHLTHVLGQLGDDDPVKVSLTTVLGMLDAGIGIDFEVCPECGAIMHDQNQHANWHAEQNRMLLEAMKRAHPEVGGD